MENICSIHVWRWNVIKFGKTLFHNLNNGISNDSKLYMWRFCFIVHLSRRLKCTIVIMHCPSSVRRPSVVRLSSLTFHIFDISSETAERNLTKLYRKLDLNILYQVCVFRADRKNKMTALASDWLRHFRLLL